MQKVVPTPLDASVLLISQRWGTSIEMKCTYHAPPDVAEDHDAGGDRNGGDDHGGENYDGDNYDGDKLAIVVVGRDGSHTALATWIAQPGVTALPSGSTSMAINAIAAIQVVSADQGSVLLAQTR
jgi:hypothetical protein